MEKDVEGQKPSSIPFYRMVADQGVLTPEIINYHYKGSGTEEAPYLVEWIPNDTRNPQNFSQLRKWFYTAIVAIATLAVAFVSSAYSGGIDQILREFGSSEEVGILGISLFVLGFAIGPLLWAPMSELFGRQYLFIGTYGVLTAFNAGAAGANSMPTLIILRFFAGSFGSSPLTNAGGVIADMFAAEQRGIAIALFAAAPFLGPVIGPIVGGFVGETIGWRWVEGVMAIFTGVLWIFGTCFLPETYAPVLLRRRATALSKHTGKVYLSKTDAERGKVEFAAVFKTALGRPWILLFREPIVLLLSLYMAIIYGVLYMLFAAFPIVYQEGRGWSQGIGGLAFLGVAIGMVFAVIYNIWDNKRYIRVSRAHKGFAPPEARLPPAWPGSIAIVVGLFWFAWTNSPSLPWEASVAAGIPFGFGMVLVFLSVFNYLIDAYVIYAASVLAANSVMRSLFGAAFPLFTTQMYANLGIHWASSIPAFLALGCLPMPFLFYKYGPKIREKCKFAAQAAAFLRRMQESTPDDDDHEDEQSVPAESHKEEEEKERDEEEEMHDTGGERQFEQMRTEQEMRADANNELRQTKSYEHNPYDIDHHSTRDDFARTRSRSKSRER